MVECQSGPAPENLTALAHFSVSSAMRRRLVGRSRNLSVRENMKTPSGSARSLVGLDIDYVVRQRESLRPRLLLTRTRYQGTDIVSPSRAGACAGRRRARVACSKLNPRDKSFC